MHMSTKTRYKDLKWIEAKYSYARERAGTEVARQFDNFEEAATYTESWDKKQDQLLMELVVGSLRSII